MSSAQKNLIINSRERAVSDDINRLQRFLGAGFAQVLRYWLLASVNEDTGIVTIPSSIASPSTAMIMNGLLCQPQSASVDLLITPGVLAVCDPDASPSDDDSPIKLIDDPGISVLGTLALNPNGAGSIRIDVVEVARSIATRDGDGTVNYAATVIETSSRDIYDPTLGTFAATTVDKVRQEKLTYRIRQGIAGSGFPGTVAGWFPLMVVSVAIGATTWDDCTCWDVRPLMNESARSGPHIRPRIVEADMLGANLLKGSLEGSFKNFVAGGVLPVGGIDLGSNDYGESGWVAALTEKVWYLWAAFPFNLPRWVRYGSAIPRIPGTFRGIAIGSGKRPTSSEGKTPASALTFPTNIGFIGQTTTDAVALFAAQASGAGALYKALTGASDAVYTETGATPINLTGAGTTKTLTLDDAASPALIPKSARALFIELLWVFETTGVETDSSSWFTVTPSIDGVDLPAVSFYAVIPAAVTTIELNLPFEIPLRPIHPDLTTLSRVITFKNTGEQVGPGLGTYGTMKAKIKGWKL